MNESCVRRSITFFVFRCLMSFSLIKKNIVHYYTSYGWAVNIPHTNEYLNDHQQNSNQRYCLSTERTQQPIYQFYEPSGRIDRPKGTQQGSNQNGTPAYIFWY